MVQYARLWLRVFAPRYEVMIHNAVTFEFKGYQVCFYEDDSEEIYRFFDTDVAKDCGELVITTKSRNFEEDFSKTANTGGVHVGIDGLTTAVDMSLEIEVADNVKTTILTIRPRDEITLVTEAGKKALYVRSTIEIEGSIYRFKKHCGYRERPEREA